VKLIAFLILGVIAIGISLFILALANAQLNENPAESTSFQRQSMRQTAQETKKFAIYGLAACGGIAGVLTFVIARRRLRARVRHSVFR